MGGFSGSIWIWLEQTVAPAVGDISTETDFMATLLIKGIHHVNAVLLLPS